MYLQRNEEIVEETEVKDQRYGSVTLYVILLVTTMQKSHDFFQMIYGDT